MSIIDQERALELAPDRAPARPETLADLSFARRKPVRWFSPATLARAGAKVVLSLVLGEYLDKRELQQSLTPRLPKADCVDDMWIDFVADTADGFNASYSVAWCVSQRSITVDGHELPRGDLLVFGGDQVYPYATAEEYEDRFRGPYEAALPWVDEDSSTPVPRLLAIPGNHDWYDGLTGFMRMFAQDGWIGGRRRAQTRSYFAERLPGRHWLWGVDIQNGAYLDTAQITFFKTAAESMKPGDRLILCAAKPSWADVDEEPGAYDNLAYVEKHLVPDDVTTVLMLSGDKHHYARYEAPAGGPRRVRLTAGGGGAFLSPTNNLSATLEVPKPRMATSCVPLQQAETETLTLEERYPAAARSRWLSLRALAVGRYNWSFTVMIAFFYVALFAFNVYSFHDDGAHIDHPSVLQLMIGHRSITSVVIVVVMAALLAAFFDAPKTLDKATRLGYRGVVGLVHTAAHVGAQAGVAWLALEVGKRYGIVAMVGCALLLGGVVGSVVFGSYLLAAFSVLKRHDTETFSAFRHEGYKNFLRIHVGPDEITVYPIGIERTCRDWEADPDAAEVDASYVRPRRGTIDMRLVDEVIALK